MALSVIVKPTPQLTFSTRYQPQTGMMSVTGNVVTGGSGNEITSGKAKGQLFSETVDWTPTTRLYLEGNINVAYNYIQTAYPVVVVSGHDQHRHPDPECQQQLHQPAAGCCGFVLDKRRTTCSSRRIAPRRTITIRRSQPAASPTGRASSSKARTLGWKHKFSDRLIAEGKAGYLRRTDGTTGGFTNYRGPLRLPVAHLRPLTAAPGEDESCQPPPEETTAERLARVESRLARLEEHLHFGISAAADPSPGAASRAIGRVRICGRAGRCLRQAVRHRRSRARRRLHPLAAPPEPARRRAGADRLRSGGRPFPPGPRRPPRLRAHLPEISGAARAWVMLYFATLRLCHFSGRHPLQRRGGLRAEALLVAAVAVDLGAGAALAFALAGGPRPRDWIGDRACRRFGLVRARLRHRPGCSRRPIRPPAMRWPGFVLLGIALTYGTYLLWAVGDPLLGRPVALAAAPAASLGVLPGLRGHPRRRLPGGSRPRRRTIPSPTWAPSSTAAPRLPELFVLCRARPYSARSSRRASAAARHRVSRPGRGMSGRATAAGSQPSSMPCLATWPSAWPSSRRLRCPRFLSGCPCKAWWLWRPPSGSSLASSLSQISSSMRPL